MQSVVFLFCVGIIFVFARGRDQVGCRSFSENYIHLYIFYVWILHGRLYSISKKFIKLEFLYWLCRYHVRLKERLPPVAFKTAAWSQLIKYPIQCVLGSVKVIKQLI